MLTDKTNAEFWVISDTHLIADSLHDNGAAFSQIQDTSQGKDLAYQETALAAFCRLLNEKKPAALVVTGDITFNGELVSARRFQKIFSGLTDTKLLVLPGNHDVFDGWARAFKGNDQLYTKQISPGKWREIFHQSYGAAMQKDRNSLAYSVQLNPHYLMLLLDSNIYGHKEVFTAPQTAGEISEDQIVWLRQQLEYARQHHLRPLLFMHHNLYVHNPAVNQGFVLNNAAVVRQLCREYNVKVAFSGHIHAQNIMEPQKCTPTTEVVTSSFCSYDQAYGIVEVGADTLKYKRHTFNMTPYLTEAERQNHTLAHFHDYLKNIQLRNLATNSSVNEPAGEAESPLVHKVNRLFIEMNYNYFTGHNHISKKTLSRLYSSVEYKTLVAQNPRFSSYLETLYDISSHSNLALQITY